MCDGLTWNKDNNPRIYTYIYFSNKIFFAGKKFNFSEDSKKKIGRQMSERHLSKTFQVALKKNTVMTMSLLEKNV